MRYIDADALIKKIYPMGIGDGKYTINAKAVKLAIDNTPTADVVPKSEVERLEAELDDFTVASLAECRVCGEKTTKVIADLQEKLSNAKAEVARTFRKRMNEKMGKHTHLLGKEYVQRIMREVEKEFIGEEDA